MRNWFGGVTIVAVSAAATAAILLLGGGSTAGQTEGAAYQAPRLAGTDHPGPEWHLAESHHRKLGHRGPQRRAGTISGSPRHVGRPAGGAGHRGGRRAAVQAGGAGAAERKPRAASGRRPVQSSHRGRSGSQVLRARRSAGHVPCLPFQLVQMPNKILTVFGYSNISRFIQLENHEEAPIDFWMGWSNGHWDGDTLVVDVTGFNGLTWLDRAGTSRAARCTWSSGIRPPVPTRSCTKQRLMTPTSSRGPGR